MIECKECKKGFSRLCDLSKHINIFHNNIQLYYDKWEKKENEGICKICGNYAKFRNLAYGYNNVCDDIRCLHKFKSVNLKNGMIKKYKTHASVYVKEIKEKQEKTCLEKYGFINPLKNKEIRNKIIETNIDKYGCENPLGNNNVKLKVKITNLNKYGYENAASNNQIKEKIKKTMIQNHGVTSYLKKREKIKQGMIEKYGVEQPLQDKEIHNKQQISALKLKKYKETDIYYRGSYELDFLQIYYDKIPDLQNGPSIKYKYKSKNKIYHSDFYIPSLNLIIEIKNSYLYKRDKLIIAAKEKAVISYGYNYVIIINKNYDKFNNLVL